MPSVMAKALADAYLLGDKTVHEGAMVAMDRKARLMRRGNRFAIPPTVLFSDETGRELLHHIHEMYREAGTAGDTKQLEHIHRHWDYFRAEQGLPAVPRSMEPLLRAQVEAHWHLNGAMSDLVIPRGLRLGEATVLHRDGGLHEQFTEVDSSVYYSPKSTNHRGFESMCVMRSTKHYDTKVLCLFQSKINDEANDAVLGLNRAASDLAQVWQGRPFFFLVLALAATDKQIKAASDAANHPVLIVNEASVPDYFTATLSPLVLFSY